jgi:SAM-dependent methyltransferase
VNYADQTGFLSKFSLNQVIAQVTYQAAAFWTVGNALGRSGWYGLTMGLLIAIGVVCAMAYLPLYLRLTVERRKKYSWPIKFRTVASPVLAFAAIPLLTTPARWLAWGGCLVIAVVGVLAARRALKRMPDADAIPLLPLELLVGDLAIVLIASSQGSGAFAGCAVGLSLAIVLFLVSAEGRTRWIGLVVAALAFACLPGIGAMSLLIVAEAAGASVVAAAGTIRLVLMAETHHQSNVSATVDDLTTFAAVTPEYAEEMLETATGILARNWTIDPPVEPEAVGHWYEANSEYYLYDLAQFHLAYKHIRFMLDIIELSGGRVLDYGAGIGDLSLELSRRGHDVTYLDVDGRTKAFARWRAERDWLPVTFASELDEVEGPFDTIVSLDVFEHLAEPLPVVDGLIEKVAPGGRMIVTAYFGATKSHPMHFDHDIDLGAYLRAAGLIDRKTFAMKHLRSEFLGKRGVLVFEKPK